MSMDPLPDAAEAAQPSPRSPDSTAGPGTPPPAHVDATTAAEPDGRAAPAWSRRKRQRRNARPLRLHHVGVAVESIEAALRFYGDTLGLRVVDRLELADRALKVVFVQAGNTLIELLEPTRAEANVARFLERRGPGLHHLCFGTPDIDAHLRDLKERGVDLIDEVARPGAHGQVAFIQPGAAHGVLVELIQEGRLSGPERG